MRRFAGPVPFGPTLVVVVLLLGGHAVALDGHQDHQPPILDEIIVEGATVFDQRGVQDRLRLELGEPILQDLTRLNRRLERVYHRRGYAYAKVEARFDDTTGLLTIHVDEGRFDEIEFRGVDRDLALTLAEEIDLDRGQAFNRRTTGRALRELLAETDSRLEPDRSPTREAPEPGSVSLGRRGPYELVEREGTRVLVVQLRKDVGDFSVTFGTAGREDWYNPVDGLNPALGFNGTVFAGDGVNRTFVSGYVSYKFARDRPGYTFGLERSLFDGSRLYVGAAVHDLTASDDAWRLSPTEQSLSSLAFKTTFRDYYRRRGYQLHAAGRLDDNHEVLASWRDERHEPLRNETSYSIFQDDHVFAANGAAAIGDLHALVVGYAWDTRGLERARCRSCAGNEANETTYLRHQLDNPYGSLGSQDAGVRVEWTSEISAPGTFGSDFDFRRHILNARAYTTPSPRQQVNARLLLGLSDGVLPPQRLFALGGLGSVRGYDFKEAVGEHMTLVNVEYKLRLQQHGGPTGVAFVDVGRISRPVDESRTDWLTGIGLGVEFWDSLRFDFAYRLNDIPRSFQWTVRLSPTF